jgi:hypothetical protein
MDRVSIFNYMVSNWDWHVPDLQNITVLRSKTFKNMGLGLAIPYDFDLTGVVNANYAVVPEEFRMDNVRDRVFLGVCSTEAVFRKELQEFLAKKEDFFSLINEFPYLTERAKKDITDFLDQFFDQFENPRRLDNLVNTLLTTCKIIQ